MKQSPTDRIELLQNIFDNTNSWLHFAEAKNASLSAFNVALIAIVAELKSSTSFSILIMIGLILSSIVTIWSFAPINTAPEKTPFGFLPENLLHFAYIASLEPEQYVQKLYATYWNIPNKDLDTVPQIEKDYCKEITENARITMKKQTCFQKGLRICIFTLASLIASIIWKKLSSLL